MSRERAPITKFCTTVSMSLELIYEDMSFRDLRYRRKISSTREIPVTKEDWETFKRGLALLDELKKNPYYQDGGGDYGSEMTAPKPILVIDYAETLEEWIERCKRLDRGDS